MKNIKFVLSTLFLSFCMFLIVQSETKAATINNVENKIVQKEKNNESHKKSLDQEDNKQKFINILKKNDLTMEDLAEEGSFYFADDNKIVVKLKKNPKNNIKHKKIYQIVSDSTEFNSVIETLSYSQNELENLARDWFELNQDISFTENIIIKYNYLHNRVDIKTDQLNKNDQEMLTQRYGSKIYLDIDPSFKNKIPYVKSREADWNKLGAGIGVQFSDGDCSTAGIVKKDTRYFIITAGHCVGTGDVFQWNALVGKAHVDARNLRYDFGLIFINQGSLTRYASNGLYLNDDKNPPDYDGRLRHADKPINGETLCKSGKTTGYTCGKVTSTTANVANEINYEVTKNDGWMIGSGDSGSASFRSSTGYLIGITSRVSSDYEINGSVYGHKGYFTPYVPMAEKYGISLYTSDTPTRILN